MKKTLDEETVLMLTTLADCLTTIIVDQGRDRTMAMRSMHACLKEALTRFETDMQRAMVAS